MNTQSTSPKKGSTTNHGASEKKELTKNVVGRNSAQRRIPANPATPSKTPVSSANVDHPPQERQRVWRACEACRKKKVKCNGKEPCQTCIGFNLQCHYLDSDRKVDLLHIERLESRLNSMESMFREFMERFQSNQNNAMTMQQVNEHVSSNSVVDHELQAIGSSSNDLTGQDHEHHANGSVLNPQNIPNDDEDTAGGHDLGGDEPMSTEAERRVIHADSFGELDMDENGELRYVGLGSMTAIIDTCIGLRRHIYTGLEKKGYLRRDSTLSSPPSSYILGDPPTPGHHSLVLQIPQAALVDILVSTWEKSLYHLFPVVHADELHALYADLQDPDQFDIGSAAIVFALLAICIPTARKVHGNVLENLLSNYGNDPAQQFYNTAKHFVDIPPSSSQKSRRRSSKVLIALALMSMYLTQVGSEAEAWITVGRAIRVGQDLGFHRSPDKLRLPNDEAQARRRIFWTLYILDRQLSGALGRPLAINDEDCDVEFPDVGADKSNWALEGFVAMAHLHKIIGNILRTVASVKNAQTWQNSEKYDELRSRVLTLNHQLRQWSVENVAETIKDAQSEEMLVYRHIALSSFFSAVLNLHRLYMSNPHRTSPLENSQALLQCSKAATSCIRGTSNFLSCVPTSHYTLLHGHHCFVSATVLLHCIRANSETSFVQTALSDVEEAVRCLRLLEPVWPGADRCRGIVEEYIEFTLTVLQNGRRGQCCFTHDHHDHRAAHGVDAHDSLQPTAKRTVDPLRRPHLAHQPLPPPPPPPSSSSLKRKCSSYDTPRNNSGPRSLHVPPNHHHSRPEPISWLSNHQSHHHHHHHTAPNSSSPTAPIIATTNNILAEDDTMDFSELDSMLANSTDFLFGTSANNTATGIAAAGGGPGGQGGQYSSSSSSSTMPTLPDFGTGFRFPEFPPASLYYTKI